MRLCRRFASHLLLGTLTLGTALAVGAEPAGGGDLTELPDIEVVVTASRTETESAHVAAPITVYNAKDIQQMSADTVGDVLRYVPGLTPRMYGGRGAVSSLGIRGSTSEQVLVLVDGRRLNRTQGGGVDFSDLPVEFVDRLEVLRGGASAVYGADALGGVINILTKKHAGEPRTSLSAGMGAWGAKRFTLETAGQGRGGSSTLLFQREMNDGDFPYADTRGQAAHRTNADFNGTNLQLSLERPTGGDSRFRLQVARDAVRKGVPGRLEFPTPRARQEDGQWVFDASEHLALSQTHALDFRVYRVRQRMQY
ncbi:MAG: TonB-dependent receptor plug domain-containing protein, partial [Armatimonadetes bacterium]|nr:TonB-dependent receptor plug domain-containing protein [Armatimonadota bacterium]